MQWLYQRFLMLSLRSGSMIPSLTCLGLPLYPRSASTFSPSSNSEINACQNTLMSGHCPHGNGPCILTILPVQMHKPTSSQTPGLLTWSTSNLTRKAFFVYSKISSINSNPKGCQCCHASNFPWQSEMQWKWWEAQFAVLSFDTSVSLYLQHLALRQTVQQQTSNSIFKKSSNPHTQQECNSLILKHNALRPWDPKGGEHPALYQALCLDGQNNPIEGNKLQGLFQASNKILLSQLLKQCSCNAASWCGHGKEILLISPSSCRPLLLLLLLLLLLSLHQRK